MADLKVTYYICQRRIFNKYPAPLIHRLAVKDSSGNVYFQYDRISPTQEYHSNKKFGLRKLTKEVLSWTWRKFVEIENYSPEQLFKNAVYRKEFELQGLFFHEKRRMGRTKL